MSKTRTRVEKLEGQVQAVKPPVDYAAVHAEIGASIMQKWQQAMDGELPPTPPPARPGRVQETAVLLMERLESIRARLAGSTAVPKGKS
ncbi:MAG: hypothetical protein KF770_13395 [Anaerolineae bacterium]|nr:hypothetical protein [Anaerolineae bacterium]